MEHLTQNETENQAIKNRTKIGNSTKNQQGQKQFLIKDKRGFNSVAEEIKTIQGFNELGLLT